MLRGPRNVTTTTHEFFARNSRFIRVVRVVRGKFFSKALRNIIW
jgi:hypothetical protein